MCQCTFVTRPQAFADLLPFLHLLHLLHLMHLAMSAHCLRKASARQVLAQLALKNFANRSKLVLFEASSFTACYGSFKIGNFTSLSCLCKLFPRSGTPCLERQSRLRC